MFFLTIKNLMKQKNSTSDMACLASQFPRLVGLAQASKVYRENKELASKNSNFTNNGSEPLIIKNARASCGCTVPDWPKEPIMPGTTEKIKVNYATNRVGKFTKNITLTTNVDKKPVILTIKGEVSPPPNKEKTVPTKNTEGSPRE